MASSRICSVEGCNKPVFCRGWCSAHHQRWRKHGDPLGGRFYADNSGSCAVEGCGGKARLAGYCRSHHHRLLRYGNPLDGKYYEGEQSRWLHDTANLKTDDCVAWPFPISTNGYGLVASGSERGAHRAMCVMVHGEPPSPQHEVAHSCNVRACVNPKHLRWATKSENMLDKTDHGTQMFGEKNHQHKLRTEDVVAIRALAGTCTLRSAAERFGVAISTVDRIQKRTAWAWLK